MLVFVSLCGIHISNKNSKITNQAYVVEDGFLYNDRFIISNYGLTPSYYTKIFYDTAIADSSFIPNFNQTKTTINVNVIGAKQTLNHIYVGHFFHSDSIIAWQKRNVFFYCFGIVKYRDIFEDWHTYNFCFIFVDGYFEKYKSYNYADD